MTSSFLRRAVWAPITAVLLLAGQRSAAGAQPLPPVAAPAAYLALLPADSTPRDAIPGDFTGDGVERWAILYTTPRGAEPTGVWVGIAGPGSGLVPVAGIIHAKPLDTTALSLLDLAGAPAIVLDATMEGTFSYHAVVRWDGARFLRVLQRFSSFDRTGPEDVDGDGTPEIVERQALPCFGSDVLMQRLRIYRWQGTVYEEATAAFPDVLGELGERTREELARAAGDARGQACLYGTLAYLAAVSGDADGTATACQRMLEADPEWRVPCP